MDEHLAELKFMLAAILTLISGVSAIWSAARTLF
jgi:hypothetical protein